MVDPTNDRAVIAAPDYPDQVPARIRDLALNARNAAAAPEYDEEAIRWSLWALVDAVMDCQVFA